MTSTGQQQRFGEGDEVAVRTPHRYGEGSGRGSNKAAARDGHDSRPDVDFRSDRGADEGLDHVEDRHRAGQENVAAGTTVVEDFAQDKLRNLWPFIDVTVEPFRQALQSILKRSIALNSVGQCRAELLKGALDYCRVQGLLAREMVKERRPAYARALRDCFEGRPVESTLGERRCRRVQNPVAGFDLAWQAFWATHG